MQTTGCVVDMSFLFLSTCVQAREHHTPCYMLQAYELHGALVSHACTAQQACAAAKAKCFKSSSVKYFALVVAKKACCVSMWHLFVANCIAVFVSRCVALYCTTPNELRLSLHVNLQADSAAYQAEKQLKEFGDKVPADVKSKVEAKIVSVRDAISKDDTELMKSEMEGLQQEMMGVGQAVYSQAQQGEAGAPGPDGAPGADKKDGGDNVVDAEFTDTDK